MNEAIVRSPKFLRNFVDFEINTGRDIKGEPSEKEKKRRIFELWDKRWKACDEYDFSQFYKEVYNKSLLFKSNLLSIRDKYRGDMSLWEEFDSGKRRIRKIR